MIKNRMLVLVFTFLFLAILVSCNNQGNLNGDLEREIEESAVGEESAVSNDESHEESANEQEVSGDRRERFRPEYWEGFNWEAEYFANTREPLYLDHNTPHGELAVQHLQFMSEHLYSRIPFSFREKEAAVWIVEEFLAMGHPWENIYIQEFALPEGDMRWWNLNYQGRWRSDFELRHGTQLTQNIIVTLPGRSERKIVVGAHYDSWPTPGAADNASGVVLLLESAQRMLQVDHYYTIEYVFFGAHEAGGFWAADHYMQNLTDEQSDNLILMINADVLIDGPYMFYGTAYMYTDDEGNWLPGFNDMTRRVDAIAEELNLDIFGDPLIAFLGSDNKMFLGRGYTVAYMCALYRVEREGYRGFFYMDGGQYTRGVSHSQNDCFHAIEERWPGMIRTNLNAFSIFLEAMLMMEGYND